MAVVIVASAAAFFYANTAEAPAVENPEQQGRVMDIETYVRSNISELSPEPEVLGGTFYVTKIEADNGKGEVEYEDGHIALKASFTYSIDVDRGITIHSFTTHQ